MILEKSFLEKYKQIPVDWGPLGLVQYLLAYSRVKKMGGKEDWVDTCARVSNGIYDIQKKHCEEYNRPFTEGKARLDAHKLFTLMFNFKFLPAGRGLWGMGTEAMWTHGQGVLLSCGFFSTESMIQESFRKLMNFSMLGVGCGFDADGAGSRVLQKPRGEIQIDIDDSRQGWVDSVSVLLNAYLTGGPMPLFNYKLIRPRGSILRTFGGTASGPGPLIHLHDMLYQVCEGFIGKHIDTEWIADIGNLIGVCVEAGNIRRSAEIILGKYGDKIFYALKHDEKKLLSHRYMSNNSVKCFVGCDYNEIAEHIMQRGEPGILWLENARRYGRMNGYEDGSDSKVAGVNPCSEMSLENNELCNIGDLFPSRHGSLFEYMRSAKAGYRYLKTVTLMSTGDKDVDEVMHRNRRVGLSQSGIISAFNTHGRHNMLDWCNKTYDFVSGLDADFSAWLDIPRSIRRTTVKPGGSIPLLPGEHGGLNYPIAEYYYRTIRIDKDNPIMERLQKAGYRIEDNAYGSGGNTKVIYFPVHEKHFRKAEKDVSMWEQLENMAALQRYWADNAVSGTVKFSRQESEDISTALEIYDKRLKGVSFLPQDEGVYVQAPYQPIDEATYHEARRGLKTLELEDLGSTATAPSGCDSAGCVV